jgi:hypothetical protein
MKTKHFPPGYAKAPAAVCIKSTAVVESDIALLGLARTRLLPAVPESWAGRHGRRLLKPDWGFDDGNQRYTLALYHLMAWPLDTMAEAPNMCLRAQMAR